MSDSDFLLDAIWASPDDDTPRLAYADWLEEHDFADYARYIRLSIRIAREVQHPDERSMLRLQRSTLGRESMTAYPLAFPAIGHVLHYATPNFGIATAHHETDAAEFLPELAALVAVCPTESAHSPRQRLAMNSRWVSATTSAVSTHWSVKEM